MSKKMLVWWMVGLVMMLGVAARAQNAAESKKNADDTEKALAAFRLDFALAESEDGKKINTRHYSMNIVPGYTPSNEIKIGSRVPVEGKQGDVQYIDVGTNVWSRMVERDGVLQLEVHADITTVANPDQESRIPIPAPFLRQLRINASTIAQPGRPTVIGIVDDPNSKHQFQLEVTVTKLGDEKAHI